MADKRKLQGEIERCLKRVVEGVEQFEDVWQKVHNASNANQKEKYEADLKKEIKKLQRLRDQIKTWLASNDIKDKQPLMDKRRLIETQMERFKVVERETKTKAYSKEGLGLATKVDPAQREKEEVRQWLTDSIDKLHVQIDQFESEIESVYASTKKKKLDRDRSDRVEELQGWVDRHKYHVQKLEATMRMMDNCSLETSMVKDIMDDLNYYLDCNQEPDFAENEMIYEDMDLDDVQSGVFTATSAVTGGATHPGIPEEEFNSIPSSPSASSQGPLSPKTPTTMKSTSQELFEERRRGKTTSVSGPEQIPNDTQPPPSPQVVPPSPRRPSGKPLLQNSTLPSRAGSGVGSGGGANTGATTTTKVTTPTSEKAHSLTNSKAPSISIPSQPTNGGGSSSQRGKGAAQPVPLTGHAYSIAAGGHQNSGIPVTMATQEPIVMTGVLQNAHVPEVSGQPLGPVVINATAPPTTSEVSSAHVHHAPSTMSPSAVVTVTSTVTSVPSASSHAAHQPLLTTQAPTQPSHTTQPRPQGPGSHQTQHSRSSSGSSSLSISTLSQDSLLTASHPPHPSPTPHVVMATPGTAVASVSEGLVSLSAPSAVSIASSQQQSQIAPAPSEASVETSSHSPSTQSSSSSSPSPSPAEVCSSLQPSTPPPTLTTATSQQQQQQQQQQQEQSSATTSRPVTSESDFSSQAVLSMPVGAGSLPGLTVATSLSSQSSSSSSSEASGSVGSLPMWMAASGPLISSATLSSITNTGLSAPGAVGSVSTSSPPDVQSSVSQAFFSSAFSSSSSSAVPHPSTPHLSTYTLAASLQTSASAFVPTEPLLSTSETSLTLSSLKSMAAQVVASTKAVPSDSAKPEISEPMIRPVLDTMGAVPGTRLEGVSQTRTDTQLEPLLGVTPLGPVQLNQEKVYQLKMLEGGCKHLPLPSDSERVRPYLQRTPYPTPYYHHQHPPPHFDSFEFFQRLSIETLFFVFYYMEGTKAQYMAAKALKRLSWRFHTKYMMWFQRLEEPKAITDDYEMGTYIYFDFEKWSQRKKEGFTFEYRYLEDKDLP